MPNQVYVENEFHAEVRTNRMKRRIGIVFLMALAVPGLYAQDQAKPVSTQDLFAAQLIPRNTKVYIAPFKSESTEKPIEGFESYMAAALRKKSVPLLIVSERTMADFEIEGTADKKGAGWAKKIFLGDFRNSTSASLTVTNIKTGVVAYADSSDRASANRGMRSSAEKLAKYLKKKIEDDEKKGR